MSDANGRMTPQYPPGTQVLHLALDPAGNFTMAGSLQSPKEGFWLLKLAKRELDKQLDELQKQGAIVQAPPGLRI